MVTEAAQRVLEVVRAAPGLSVSAVARASEVEQSTASYHLRRLEREARVAAMPVGRDLCWYAADCGLCPVLRRAVPLLRRDETRALALAMDETPASALALSERSAVPLGTVRWIIPVLAGATLAERTRNGRTFLREGAATCIAKAVAAERCDRWGQCPVSKAWLAERVGAEEASAR